jgi:hypothetical protein
VPIFDPKIYDSLNIQEGNVFLSERRKFVKTHTVLLQVDEAICPTANFSRTFVLIGTIYSDATPHHIHMNAQLGGWFSFVPL